MFQGIMVRMGNLPEPAWRDKLGRTVWIAVGGDYFHREAVYVKARTEAAALDVIALERAHFGHPRWVGYAGDATARRVLFARYGRKLQVRLPVLEESLH